MRNKNKNSKNNNKTNLTKRSRYNQNVKLSRRMISLISQPVNRKIVIPVDVYANYFYNGSTTSYSLSSTPSATPTIYYNAITNFLNDVEFTKMATLYNYVKVRNVGFSICSTSCLNTNILADLPEIFVTLQQLSSLSTQTFTTVAKSDQSVSFKVNNQAGSISKLICSMPAFIEGSNGYCFGSNIWLSTNTTALGNFSLYLMIGFLTAPSFNSSLAANASQRVAVIDLEFDCVFASPYLTS